MKKRNLRQLTRNFHDVRGLLIEHNNLKRQLKRVDRRLITLENKYRFLSEIVSIKGQADLIEVATKKLLKSAGFKDVRRLKNVRPKREDLQVWCNDCLILIECKGTYKPIPPDNEIGQIKKYIDYRKNIINGPLPVYGFTVINHDHDKQYKNRHTAPFDKFKTDYALAGSYGLLTTVELLNGFILLKNGEIGFEEFKTTLLKKGEIKFSGRADNT